MARLSTALLAALAAAPAPLARAESFRFDDAQVARPGAMHTHFHFYVYGAEHAPARWLGQPTVTANLLLVPDGKRPAAHEKLAAYASLEVSLIPLELFGVAVNTSSFCSALDGPADVPKLALRPGTPKDRVASFVVAGGRAATPRTATLPATGVYVLVSTNCGDLRGFKLSGTVSVQNPHGYLPANEYSVRSMYGLFAFVYVGCVAVWARLYAHWRSTLLRVQGELLLVSAIGVAECFSLFVAYDRLNKTGNFNLACFWAGSTFSLCKVCMLFRAGLLAPEAFNNTSRCSSRKVLLALAAYAAAASNLRSVSFFRSRYGVSGATVVGNALPAAAVGLALFSWSFCGMTHAGQLFMELQSKEQALLMSRSSFVLATAAVGATAALGAHVADPSLGADASRWGAHAMCSDGFAQAVFALALLASMLVWRPSEATRSCSGGAYSVAAPSAPDVEGVAIGAPAADAESEASSGAPHAVPAE